MFNKAREAVRKRMDKAAAEMAEHIENETKAFPPKIRIGRYEIETWYSAPYPQVSGVPRMSRPGNMLRNC